MVIRWTNTFDNVTKDDNLQEEIFGPVVCVVRAKIMMKH